MVSRPLKPVEATASPLLCGNFCDLTRRCSLRNLIFSVILSLAKAPLVGFEERAREVIIQAIRLDTDT